MNQETEEMKIPIPSVNTLGGYWLRQGPLVVAMTAGLIWFNTQHRELQQDMRSCNESTIEIYKAQNAALMAILSRATDALEESNRTLNDLKYRKRK